ncbi:MAG: peptidase [Rhodothermaceae bacterium]|nr:peptidase [Rhodothermaceae bacterium]
MPLNGAQLPLHILFVFLDGIGLGEKNQETNPLIKFDLPHFNILAGNQPWSDSFRPVDSESHVFTSIDATLGIPGLPQSGTGQATLFTGTNCAETAGKHFGPYPHSKTKPIIAESSIFQQVNQLQLDHPEPAAFANAYPPQFFEAAKARNRWTVTTLSCIEAEIKIRTLDDLKVNKALTAEITRKAWRTRLSIPVDPITEQTAANHLHQISASHPFTLYEYYLTDKAGHSQSFPKAHRVLSALDALFGELLRVIDIEQTLLLITSDHGNIEDLSVKTHTFNRVPLIAYGKGAHLFREARSLTDVTPSIISALATANKSVRK